MADHPTVGGKEGFHQSRTEQHGYGVPETPGTAAIDRSQWLPPGSEVTAVQANAYINQFRSQISGYVPNGHGGYTQVFSGVSDNMGPASGVSKLETTYPGRVDVARAKRIP